MTEPTPPTVEEAEAEYWAAIAAQESAARTAEAATAALDDASDRVARAHRELRRARGREAVGRPLPPEERVVLEDVQVTYTDEGVSVTGRIPAGHAPLLADPVHLSIGRPLPEGE